MESGKICDTPTGIGKTKKIDIELVNLVEGVDDDFSTRNFWFAKRILS